MIIEKRTYTVAPGATTEYMRLYKRERLAIQTATLGNLVGWFVSEIGPLDRTVHLWGYDDLEDRSRRRARPAQAEDWLALLPKIRPLIIDQESVILTPAPFSPIR